MVEQVDQNKESFSVIVSTINTSRSEASQSQSQNISHSSVLKSTCCYVFLFFSIFLFFFAFGIFYQALAYS